MMTTISHISDEELMAFAEGELPAGEAQAVEVHLEECTECSARLAVWQQDAEPLKHTLASWTAEPVPERVEHVVLGALSGKNGRRSGSRSIRGGDRWSLWAGAVAGLAAVAVVIGYVGVQHQPQRLATYSSTRDVPQPTAPGAIYEDKAEPLPNRATPVMPPPSAAVAGMMTKVPAAPPPPPPSLKAPPMMAAKMAPSPIGGGGPLHAPTRLPKTVTAALGPMIARTASLSILVDNVDRERVVLEGLLARYGGYAAQMQVNTSSDSTRNLTASLRVPATALPQAIADLRTLGKVQNESQSGEDVGQDHADLEARLNTARSTEDRLRGILREHTGSVSDVLEVEEEIATTREKIESMEAELDGMEHRVRYATIEVQLNETTTKPATAGGRLGEAIAAGWHNAGDLVLGLALWLAEDGPAIVIVLLLIGVPAVLLWRRYRRMHDSD